MLDGADRGGGGALLSPTPPTPHHCESLPLLPSDPEASPAVAAVMFAAGLVGNLTALGLLAAAGRRRRARRGRPAPFHVLVRALALTDLLGTCLLSPAVLAAYARGRTLVALVDGGGLCRAFAFAMSFFGLATTGCLGAMALERSLALGAPYLYERLLGRRGGEGPGRPPWRLAGALAAFYALAAVLCALPLLGFGRYVQYCPGTWCFIQMRGVAVGAESGRAVLAFSLLYASLLLLLIAAVLLCNLCAIACLLRMHRRGQAARRPPTLAPPDGAAAAAAAAARRRPRSVSEELDHLILLAIMTLTFAVCSLPFTIRAFKNYFAPDEHYEEDLRAMRFLSVNSIIDPWVFAILRPSVLRMIRSMLCCRMSFKPQTQKGQRPSLATPKPTQQAVTNNSSLVLFRQ